MNIKETRARLKRFGLAYRETGNIPNVGKTGYTYWAAAGASKGIAIEGPYSKVHGGDARRLLVEFIEGLAEKGKYESILAAQENGGG